MTITAAIKAVQISAPIIAERALIFEAVASVVLASALIVEGIAVTAQALASVIEEHAAIIKADASTIKLAVLTVKPANFGKNTHFSAAIIQNPLNPNSQLSN